MQNDLKKIKNDLIFIFETGFTKVYPLLIPFFELKNILQTEDLSCVFCVVIINHYINKIKENIKHYNIGNSG